MKKTIIWIFCLLVLVGGACSRTSSEQTGVAEVVFFDLEDYFRFECVRLNKADYPIRKRMTVDGEIEEKQIEDVNFINELNVFSVLNINRLAWSDKYRVDSIFEQSGQLSAIDYTAVDEQMKTKKLIVTFDLRGDVNAINIQKESKTAILDSKQSLSYYPASGYQIETYQKIPFFDDKEVLLEVEFIQ